MRRPTSTNDVLWLDDVVFAGAPDGQSRWLMGVLGAETESALRLGADVCVHMTMVPDRSVWSVDVSVDEGARRHLGYVVSVQFMISLVQSVGIRHRMHW